MSEYTPTTEEVRDNYLPPRTEIKDAEKQFDRWLAEHDREVIREFINQQVEYVRNVMASKGTE